MINLGWLGGLCLASCGFPAAVQAYREGHAKGLNLWFLILWTLGEIFTIFAITSDAPLGYLLFNYGSNLVFLAIIWRYKIFPRTSTNLGVE